MLKGLDISHWQGTLDFNDLRSNFDFVIIKASEGNGGADAQLTRSQSEARRVGILTGYYHFARPDLKNSAIAEADWFLKTVGTLQTGEMLCLDYESSWGGDVVGWCKDFLDEVFAKTKVRPLIYLNQALVKKYIWKSVIANYGLWLAVYDYDANKSCPATPWPSVTIKQYTDKLVYNGLVDGDVFYGDQNAFKSYGFNSSDDNMTQDQTNILAFLTTQNANEGKVREAFGALADIPNLNKQITDLKTSLDNLNNKVADLTVQLALVQKSADDCQLALKAANKTNQNISADLAYYQPYKARYEAALKSTIDKYTGWQLVKMGINKLIAKQ